MKKGTRVRSPWGNKGFIVVVNGNLAKVILDKDRVINKKDQHGEDLKRACWYYLIELEVINV